MIQQSHLEFLLNHVRVKSRQRYVFSLAGPLWALLHPLILLAIFWLVFSRVMPTRLVVGDSNISYGLFLVTGFFVWQCCNDIITSGTTALHSNATLIKRLPVPLFFFSLESFLLALVGLLVSFPLVLLFLLVCGVTPTAFWLLSLLSLALALAQALALAVIGGMLNVFFRDVELFLPAGLQLLLWTAPIVYPPTAIGERLQPLLHLNPFSAPMILLRDQLLYGHPGDLSQWLFGLGWSLLLGVIAATLYRRMQREVRDNL